RQTFRTMYGKALYRYGPWAVPEGGSRKAKLLELDLGAGSFQLGLEVFGLGLGNAFLDGLRSSLDQVLGFLEPEAGDAADFLDDVDLLGTGIGEDHVELGLLFGSGSRSGTASSGDGHGSGGGNAPLLFQELGELGSFQDGQGRQLVNELFEISHFNQPLQSLVSV